MEKVNEVQAKKKALRTPSANSERIPALEADVRRLRADVRRFKKQLREETNKIKGIESVIQKGRRTNKRSASYLERETEVMKKFIQQIDANVKSQVDFSDFQILTDNVSMVGRDSLPEPLVAISEKIKESFGDITSGSSQSDCAAMPSYVLFCAAIKEMDELTLDGITEHRILLWRDAINSALNVEFNVEFARKHLKKIARAYFGLKAMDEFGNKELRNVDEMVSETEGPEDCLREVKYFRGKPLTAGLFS